MIEAMPTKNVRPCFTIKLMPIIQERKLKETPTLLPFDLSKDFGAPLRFKDLASLVNNFEQVTKAIG